MNKREFGITLIALVVTIIVMLILAGVSLNAMIGNNGVITQAQNAKIAQEDAAWYENAEQTLVSARIDKDKIENMAEYLKAKFLEYDDTVEVIVTKLGEGYIIIAGDRLITVNGDFEITSSKSNTYLVSKSDEWLFEVVNGTAKLTACNLDLIGTVQIPYAVVDRKSDEANPQVYIVTAIGNNVFDHATNVTKIDFSQVSNTLTSIGSLTFAFCSDLEINVPEDLPSSLISIGDKAFYGCSKLNGNINIIMAKGYTLGKGVFMKCSNLTGDIQNVFDQNFYIDTDTNQPVETEITESQFSGYSGLKGSLTIPYYITSIGNNAFYGCSSITSLEFEDTAENPSRCTSIGNYAFYGDSGISNSITFPDSIKTMGKSAFYSCSGITGITLSKNLESMGGYAFYGCSNISGKLIIPKTLNILSDRVFWNCSKINEVEFEYIISDEEKIGCKTIKDGAFLSNTSLTKVTLPETLEVIEGRAFDWGKSIEELYIPDSVTTIGGAAFRSQNEMKVTHWSTNLTTIKDEAFEDCYKITTLPNTTSLVTIGASAFLSCTSLGKTDSNGKTNIIDYLEDSIITNVGSNCFSSDTYLEGKFEGSISNKNKDTITLGGSLFLGTSVVRESTIPTGEITVIVDYAYDSVNKFNDSSKKEVTEITIPNTVTSIGNYAFSGCSTITKITIPKSVTSIGIGAFMNCTNLTEIVFEEGINLTTIPDYMCQNDTSLSKFIIPSTITSIGEYAFLSCSNLITVNIPSSVTMIGDSAYRSAGITNLTLNEGLKSIGNSSFSYINCSEVVIPDSVTYLGFCSFQVCRKLTKITLGEGIDQISSNSINNCPNLTTVIVKGNIKYIEEGAFSSDSSLTLSGIIGLDWYKVTSIGKGAFRDCISLKGTVKVNSKCVIDENALGSNCPLIITK
jgi:hypothetical protein